MPHRNARLVVVGAGFAGASLVRGLPPALRRPGETLLIDREDSYPFIPLIHEVAVGRIHPRSVTSPIQPLCEGRCDFLRSEVTNIDLANKTLETSSGEVGYEYLALTAGSVATPPPENLRENLQPFWNLDDALRLRYNLADAWWAVLSRKADGSEPGALTVAVVGGGATGVELAAEVSTLFDYLKKRTTRNLPEEPRVVLFEAADRLLGWLDPYFHEVAMEELASLGVEVRLGAAVEEAGEKGIKAGGEWLPSRTRIWAAGVKASPLVENLPVEKGPSGRARVDEYLTLENHPEVYLPGDGGVYTDTRYGPLPPTASVAVQEGPFVARDLERRLGGERRRPPFRYFNRGYIVSLGPESAVAETVGVRFRGAAAQALYRSIFLYYMQGRRDRVLTGADWAMERTVGRLGFENRERRERVVSL